jgi:hypothetical protein
MIPKVFLSSISLIKSDISYFEVAKIVNLIES